MLKGLMAVRTGVSQQTCVPKNVGYCYCKEREDKDSYDTAVDTNNMER